MSARDNQDHPAASVPFVIRWNSCWHEAEIQHRGKTQTRMHSISSDSSVMDYIKGKARETERKGIGERRKREANLVDQGPDAVAGAGRIVLVRNGSLGGAHAGEIDDDSLALGVSNDGARRQLTIKPEHDFDDGLERLVALESENVSEVDGEVLSVESLVDADVHGVVLVVEGKRGTGGDCASGGRLDDTISVQDSGLACEPIVSLTKEAQYEMVYHS